MNKKAFTLIEAVITALIGSFILLGVSSVIILNSEMSKKSVLEVQATELYNSILNQLKFDVRNGADIKIIKKNGISTSEIRSRDSLSFVSWSCKKITDTDGKEYFRLFRSINGGKEIEYKVHSADKYSIEAKFLHEDTPDAIEEEKKSYFKLVLDIKFDVWSENKKYNISSKKGYSRYYIQCRNKLKIKK